ncbi:MAG: hypothetical protein JZU50_03555 [Desulfobulbaceae bacterium]|jgi:hypothetical protein|nr:hypothetical protein [Desulfobulbaceae bacterium]
MHTSDDEPPAPRAVQLVELRLLVPEDLYRAFQRCLWVQINETGQTQLHLMEQVVLDFLVKHDC